MVAQYGTQSVQLKYLLIQCIQALCGGARFVEGIMSSKLKRPVSLRNLLSVFTYFVPESVALNGIGVVEDLQNFFAE